MVNDFYFLEEKDGLKPIFHWRKGAKAGFGVAGDEWLVGGNPSAASTQRKWDRPLIKNCTLRDGPDSHTRAKLTVEYNGEQSYMSMFFPIFHVDRQASVQSQRETGNKETQHSHKSAKKAAALPEWRQEARVTSVEAFDLRFLINGDYGPCACRQQRAFPRCRGIEQTAATEERVNPFDPS
ncbi:hypothetical protein Q5P01_022459 [Channa striata]|uniref:Uncharacterized protein n=1 Tax=Channa striata TaxID=64152 RepID=A0AA88IX82_CHASR|nr:hypothetical protein Q5P01_022459 [Channa striata]